MCWSIFGSSVFAICPILSSSSPGSQSAEERSCGDWSSPHLYRFCPSPSPRWHTDSQGFWRTQSVCAASIWMYTTHTHRSTLHTQTHSHSKTSNKGLVSMDAHTSMLGAAQWTDPHLPSHHREEVRRAGKSKRLFAISGCVSAVSPVIRWAQRGLTHSCILATGFWCML